MSDAVEIRRNPDGSIDEIVAKGANLHVEQMSADGWYMGLDMPDGSYWQFWFGSKNRRSAVEFRHTETSSAERLDNLRNHKSNAGVKDKGLIYLTPLDRG